MESSLAGSSLRMAVLVKVRNEVMPVTGREAEARAVRLAALKAPRTKRDMME